MATGFSKNRTIVNIGSQWVTQLVNLTVTLGLIGYAVGVLGAEHYGGWAAIVSVIGYLTMLDAGMSVTVQYYVSRYTTSGEKGRISVFYSAAHVIYGIAGLVSLCVCYLLALDSSFLFKNLSSAVAAENGAALKWVGAGMFLFMMSMPAQGALMGSQHHAIKNLIEIISVVIRLLVVLLCFNFLTPSLAYLGFAFFISCLFRFVLCRMAIARVDSSLTVDLKLINRVALIDVFSFGGHATFWSVATAIVRESGPLLALLSLGSKESTYVYVGTRLVRSMGIFVQSAAQVFMPIATSLNESSDVEALRKLLITGTRYCALLGVAAAGVLLAFGESILWHWLGDDGAYSVVLITTLGTVGVWIFQVALSMIMGLKVLWPITAMMVFRMVFAVVLALVLGQYYGIAGLALGLVVPVALTSFFYIPWLAVRRVDVAGSELIKTICVPVLIGVLTGCMAYLLQRIWNPVELSMLVAELISVFLFFAVLSHFWGIDSQSRSMITRKFQSLVGA